MRVAVWAAFAAVSAGCVAPASDDPEPSVLDGLLEYVAALHGDDVFPASLAPYVAEAAWAAGLDPAAWPPDHPVLPDISTPADAPLLQQLRPLHALALAMAPGAQERRTHILEAFDGTQFGDPQLLNDDAYALLALVADGQPLDSVALRASADFLLSHRRGGWSHALGGQADTDMTGIVLVALDAVERIADVPQVDVTAVLEAARDGDGYGARAGAAANCNSSVWALRGFSALGVDIPAAGWGYIDGLRQPDGGFAYGPGDDSNALCSLEVATLYGLRETGRLPGV